MFDRRIIKTLNSSSFVVLEFNAGTHQCSPYLVRFFIPLRLDSTRVEVFNLAYFVTFS